MEAKVDVRKLQILNDRINQTIDALNQVRLSVHGLAHAGGLQPPFHPFMGQGYGMQQPFGMGTPGLGFQPGVQGGFPGFGQQSPFGLQHSPFQQLTNPYVSQGLSPWSQIGSPWSALGQTGYYGGIGGGLYHTSPDFIERQLIEARANDPFRITQTFPFVVS